MRAALEFSFTSFLDLITFSIGVKGKWLGKGPKIWTIRTSPRLSTLVEDNEGHVKLTKARVGNQRQEHTRAGSEVTKEPGETSQHFNDQHSWANSRPFNFLLCLFLLNT